MTPGLPPDLSPGDLPPHKRGPWVQDFHAPSPDGQHVVTIYGYDEHRMGYMHGHAIWSATKTPWAAKGAITRLPLMNFAHWISASRFALKPTAFHVTWIRPMVVIDLAGTFAILPNSSGETPDLGILMHPIEVPFAPFTPQALAVELDLIHLS